jgi:hypothetical protein
MRIEPKFDDAEPFSDGSALVKLNKLYGYIDHTGSLVIAPQFESADDFSDGLAPVGKWNDRGSEFYYIDKSGRQAIPERFVLASHFFKGLAHVKLKANKKDADESNLKGTFAYINVTGKKIFTYVNNPKDED